MFEVGYGYAKEGMAAYVRLQKREFESVDDGYAAVKHQMFVGTKRFVSQVISGDVSSTTAMEGSTERAQFEEKPKAQERRMPPLIPES